MSDTDREQIERGIESIGDFDIDNCTCDPSVGVYPCHYCAEREAIFAGKRVLERLAAAEAERDRLREDLLAELRSELVLASTYCANATRRHCEQRIAEHEAAKGGRDERPSILR